MSGSSLAPYVHRAHSAASEEDLLRVIHDALNDPTVYVFGELVDLPRVCALEASHPHVHRIVSAFAFGSIADIPDLFHSLSPFQQLKLRQLTIVSMAFTQKALPYGRLLDVLGLVQVRELEDTIIDAISRGVFKAKIDQKAKCLLIDEAMGRDIRDGEDLEQLIGIVGAWRGRAREVTRALDDETEYAHQRRQQDISHSLHVQRKIQDGLTMIAISEAAAQVGGVEQERVETSKKRMRDYR